MYDEAVRGVTSGGTFDPSGLAGDGRGVAGQMRVLGVILLIAGAASLLFGAFWWARGVSDRWTAARIEDGARPRTVVEFRRRSRSMTTEIVGRVVQADAVVLEGAKPWVFAPLVSDRPGADEHPRIYFGATAQAFDRAVVEQRFRGLLYHRLPFQVRQTFEAHGRPVADDVYYLVNDGSAEGNAAAGRAVMIWGLLLGTLGLLAFGFAVRRQAARRAPPPTVP